MREPKNRLAALTVLSCLLAVPLLTCRVHDLAV